MRQLLASLWPAYAQSSNAANKQVTLSYLSYSVELELSKSLHCLITSWSTWKAGMISAFHGALAAKTAMLIHCVSKCGTF
jgi:hypothetical protein